VTAIRRYIHYENFGEPILRISGTPTPPCPQRAPTDAATAFALLPARLVTDPAARAVCGRPVDVIPDAQGNLLICDDQTGAICQLYPARK